jgi:acetyl-CoA C-acetyltransferase
MDAFILDSLRTGRGAARDWGALKDTRPVDLLGALLRALPERHGLEPAQVEDCLLGCVTQTGEQGANLARIALLNAGWDQRTSGATLNRFCASGLSACVGAAHAVNAGAAGLVLAGGVESMSRVPMMSDGGPWYADPQVSRTTGFVHMGIAADLVATLEDFGREALDACALESHRRAARAQAEGRFARSIVPVPRGEGAEPFARDELVREALAPEKLAAFEPAFAKAGAAGGDAVALARYPQLACVEHRHTVASSPGMADGAALLAIASADGARRSGLRPRAQVLATADAAAEPVVMLTAGQLAAQRALERAGMSARDVHVCEFNESFAAVALKFARDIGIDPERINPNGGSIAMGHAMGATGAILLGMALEELERVDGEVGLVAISGGAGIGTAMVIRRT